MTKRQMTTLGAIALCALATVGVSAGTVPERPRDYSSVSSTLTRISPGLTLEQYIAMTLAELRRLDANADGLDAGDIEATKLLAQAQRRAATLQQIYSFDLNDDGKVEKAEVERVTESRSGMFRQRRASTDYVGMQVAEVMKADRNGDGSIDFAEARVGNPSGGDDHGTNRARELLTLDPDKDGRLLVQELETLARTAFAAIDADGSGVISLGEYDDFSTATRKTVAARQAAQRSPCTMPKPAPMHRFIVVGSNEGGALSTASVVGQDDVTTVSQVNIEPGADPLDILLITATPRIWQFQGAIGRIARVSVAANKAAGIVGLPRDKILFLAARHCMLLSATPDEIVLAIARGALRRAAGREPDAIFGHHRIGEIALPSGTVTQKSVKRPSTDVAGVAPLWGALMWHRPGGIVQVDAKSVIASGRAERYDVLPEHAGLIQLVNDGVLAYLSGGRAGPIKLKIVRPMKRFPAGLAGAHLVTFLLARGMTLPSGNVGNSCVISEEPGLVSNDSFLCAR